MKKLYTILAASVLVAGTAAADGLQPKVYFKKQHASENVSRQPKGKSEIRRAPAAGLWVAKRTVESVSDYEGGWIEYNEYNGEYDNRGLLVKDVVKCLDEYEAGDTPYTVNTNTYNESGRLIHRLVQVGPTPEELTNTEKTDRKYDEQIPSLIVESSTYSWYTGEWELMANAYTRVVTRNDAGNVTSIVYNTLYMGKFTPVQKVEIEYGEDGKATSVTEWQLSYDDNYNEYWKEGYSMRDCTWYETDGQIWSTDAIFEGGNKVKSFTEYSEGDFVGEVSVTYTPGTDDFVSTLTGDGFVSTQEWTDLENGGFNSSMSISISYPGFEDYGYTEVMREEYDILGNCVLAADVLYQNDGTIEIYQWDQAESTYDENGCPTCVILRSFVPTEGDDEWPELSLKKAKEYDFSTPPLEGIWFDALKYDFSDFQFIETSGMTEIEVAADAPVEYYSLEGRRVDNPSAGIYIRRQGSKVQKISIR